MRRAAPFLILALGGCTLSRMEGFDAIATDAERLDVTGIPGWQSGDFRLGTAIGHVRREADGDERGWSGGRHGLVDLERSGRLRFTIAGAEVGGALEGDCLYERREQQDRRGSVTVSAPTRPLTLACSYRFDGAPAGVLDLAAAPAGVEARVGRLRIGGVDLRLVSTHRMVGLSVPADAPIGYRIEDADGATIGAVETNGIGTRRLALPRESGQRRAALAAGLTLALFWDPGDTD